MKKTGHNRRIAQEYRQRRSLPASLRVPGIADRDVFGMISSAVVKETAMIPSGSSGSMQCCRKPAAIG
jgi:hypothetical protein